MFDIVDRNSNGYLLMTVLAESMTGEDNQSFNINGTDKKRKIDKKKLATDVQILLLSCLKRYKT